MHYNNFKYEKNKEDANSIIINNFSFLYTCGYKVIFNDEHSFDPRLELYNKDKNLKITFYIAWLDLAKGKIIDIDYNHPKIKLRRYHFGDYFHVSYVIKRCAVFIPKYFAVEDIYKYVDNKYEIINNPNDLSRYQLIELLAEFTKKYMMPVIEGKMSFRKFYSHYGINPKDLK